MTRPITLEEHRQGEAWLLKRQAIHVSSIISISDLQAYLPGLAGMPHDEVLALVVAPSSCSTDGMIIYRVEDVLRWWCAHRP
ncbi:MAG TPA: hypothetical protein VGM97_11345 [Steroidobacteraceae bacterium]|jgi:hypothetical protein